MLQEFVIGYMYSVYQKESYSQKIFFINMKFFQKVYVFDTISKRNKCSFCCFLNYTFYFC